MKTELYSKPFKKYPSIISFLILPFHPSSIKTSFSFIFTAWKSFVVIQNKQKFHITRKNVVNVEHPLDEKIPFVPSNVKIYTLDYKRKNDHRKNQNKIDLFLQAK